MNANSERTTAPVHSLRGWVNRHPLFARWSVVLLSGLAIALIPVPSGVTRQSWNLFAIFVSTIVGSIVQPIPAGAIVLMAVTTVALTRALTVGEALAGYADPIVWICLPAFFISRAMLKTGLGRRIAFLFIRKPRSSLAWSGLCAGLHRFCVRRCNSFKCRALRRRNPGIPRRSGIVPAHRAGRRHAPCRSRSRRRRRALPRR